MLEAIKISQKRMRENYGGPFGAVIVRNGRIIARGFNCVTSTNDPTAHAEIVAIRAAGKKLKSFQLADCEMFSSCEPCPMCLAAIYWARLGGIYYANTKKDAAAIGFDDAFIYREMRLPLQKRRLKMKQMLRGEALKVFNEWKKKPDKIQY